MKNEDNNSNNIGAEGFISDEEAGSAAGGVMKSVRRNGISCKNCGKPFVPKTQSERDEGLCSACRSKK